MGNRDDLIMQLADSMGHGAAAATKYGPARFDSGTNTLYCNGHVITQSTIFETLEFLEYQKQYCQKAGGDAHDKVLYCEVAIEAVKWMTQQKKDMGGEEQ